MCTNSTRLPLPHTRTCLLLLCLNTADSHPCNCSTVNAAPTPTRFHAPRPQISRIRNPRTPTKTLDCNPKAARKDRRSLSRRSHENMRRFPNDVGPGFRRILRRAGPCARLISRPFVFVSLSCLASWCSFSSFCLMFSSQRTV